MIMRVHRFNKDGIAAFESYIIQLARTSKLAPPFSLLHNKSLATRISDVNIEYKEMETRFEIARYLNRKLSTLEKQFDVLEDVGLWSWLSLFYFDLICPENVKGARKPGELARYIPNVGDFRKYYRHLLAGPYLTYKAHEDNPERTMGLLANPPHKIGDIYEQIASVQGSITSPGVVSMVTQLYYDFDIETLKPGSGGKALGSARRLRDFLNQIDLTWDLHSISSDQLMSLLPDEFTKYRES